MSDAGIPLGWASDLVDVRAGVVAAQMAGSGEGPAVLLLGGATWSRDWWPDEFCGRLVDAGMRVIRFDPRDTGESTHSPVGVPDYDADDLTADVLAVLDHYSVSKAVVVGLSMGGGIAQSLAAQHPSRVSALVLISTSPAYETDAPLPPPTPELQATFAAQPADVDVTDREAIIAACIEAERPYAGPGLLDEAGIREAVGRTWDRDPTCRPPAITSSSREPTVHRPDPTAYPESSCTAPRIRCFLCGTARCWHRSSGCRWSCWTAWVTKCPRRRTGTTW